jgi:phage FluMu protein Com
MNLYDTIVIRCTKCNKAIGEVESGAEIIFPKCSKCVEPIPDADKLAYTLSNFNINDKNFTFAIHY